MFGIGKIQTLAIAAVALSVIAGGIYIKGRSDGRAVGMLAALKAENAQLIERDETDAEVENLGRYELCVDLLGRVPDCDEFKD